jgi:hypothetical protein
MAVETPLPDISDNITLFKSIYSIGLLIFSVAMVMGLIFTGQTKISSEVSPILAFGVIWFAIIWLTMVEGGQASLVGLAPVNPISTRCLIRKLTPPARSSSLATTLTGTFSVVNSWLF